MNASNSSRCGLCLGSLLASHIIPDRWRHCRRRCPPRRGISRLSQARGTQKIRRRGGISTSSSPSPVTYLSFTKRKMPSHGVCRAGQKTLKQKLKRSANMVLALPPLGSLSRGAITFPRRPSWSEMIKITTQSLLLARTSNMDSVRSIDRTSSTP